MYKMFNTHEHLDHKRYNKNRKELIEQIHNTGVEYVVVPTISYETNFSMREKLNEYEWIYYAVGIHPARLNSVDFESAEIKEKLYSLAQESKTVAVGECGLDYCRVKDKYERKRQESWFRYQIELAEKVDKPLVLHIRDADKQGIKILKSYHKHFNGVCHCFCSSYRWAKKYIELGFYLGIGGSITFEGKAYDRLRKAVKKIPLEHIVLETDGPFLPPLGYEGRTNSSLSLPIIIEKIAEIKGVSPEIVADIVYTNAMKIFNINDIE